MSDLNTSGSEGYISDESETLSWAERPSASPADDENLATLELGERLYERTRLPASLKPAWDQFVREIAFADLADHLRIRMSTLASTFAERNHDLVKRGHVDISVNSSDPVGVQWKLLYTKMQVAWGALARLLNDSIIDPFADYSSDLDGFVDGVNTIQDVNAPAVEAAMNTALQGGQDVERWDSFRLALQEMGEQLTFLTDASALLATMEEFRTRRPGI